MAFNAKVTANSRIRWEDPPPVTRKSEVAGGSKWNVIIPRLKERPGEWGRLPGEWSMGFTAFLRRQTVVLEADPVEGCYEFTSRTVTNNDDKRRVAIWGRWVPAETEG